MTQPPSPVQSFWPHLPDAFHALWNLPERNDRPALVDDSRSYTYSALYEAVSRFAGWLRTSGVAGGDRIGIAMQRGSQFAIAILGTMVAGACPCPLEPKLTPDESRRRKRVAALKWVIVDAGNEHEAVASGFDAAHTLHADAAPGDAAPYWSTRVEPAHDAFLLFTSGSSGLPKGVLQNHRGLLTNATGVMRHTGLGARDRLLHIMPLHHTNGVNNQLFAPLLAGSSVVITDRFKAEAMPALMLRHRPTLVTGVPTMYARMLPLAFAPEALAQLRMLRCGSAPITEELHRRIEEKFGLPLVVSYGLSEATCTSTMNPPDRRKVGSVGTPLAGQHVFLRRADGEHTTRANVEGEICIGGPSLMTGYLLDDTDGKPQPPGAELRTGDLGRFDDEGYLSVTGRLKDVIIRGGENLSPGVIEEAIAAVPGVAACCVVGKTDADLGEVPVAFVVRRDDTDGHALSESLVSSAAAERLPRTHRPAQWFFVGLLPENGTGKIDRKRLREAAAAQS